MQILTYSDLLPGASPTKGHASAKDQAGFQPDHFTYSPDSMAGPPQLGHVSGDKPVCHKRYQYDLQ